MVTAAQAYWLNRKRRLDRGASAYAPYAAPAGYAWEFVMYNGVRVTYEDDFVVALRRT